MPNYCDYTMKVKGFPNNVQKFINVIKADYDYGSEAFLKHPNNHLFRVFEADVTELPDEAQLRCVIIDGYCAWSVYSCMLEGPYTYLESSEQERSTQYGTSLLRLAKNLNLLIEVFSKEPGCCFAEHYAINNRGKYDKDQTFAYCEMYIDESQDPEYCATYDDVIKFYDEHNLCHDTMTKELFNEIAKDNDYIECGGFYNPYIEDPPFLYETPKDDMVIPAPMIKYMVTPLSSAK